MAAYPKPTQLSSCWETLQNPATRAPYYYCHATSATLNEPPAASPAAPALLLPLGWQAHFHASDREVYFFHEERNETVWDAPPGHVFLPEPADIVNDLAVYWETFLDKEGAPYFHHEATNSTRYELPTAVVPSRTPGQTRGKLPVVLPQGWYAAANAAGEVYFVREEPSVTSWDLPRGAYTVATLGASAAGAGGGGGSRGGGAGGSSSSGGAGAGSGAASAAATRRQRAEALLQRAVAAFVRAGRALPPGAPWAPRLPHRPRLFFNTADGGFMVLNPQAERDALRAFLAEGSHVLLGGALRGADARTYGFAEANARAAAGARARAPPTLWHCHKDPTSGKLYYFNPRLEGAAPVWELPAGGRVVVRTLDDREDLAVRARKMVEAREELKARRARKAGGGGGGGGGGRGGSAAAAAAATTSSAAAAAAAAAAPAALERAGGGAAAAAAARPPTAKEATVEISSADGTKITDYWLVLDPPSRLLVAFRSKDMLPGSECGVMDMLAAAVYDKAPAGAVNVAHAHSLWVHTPEEGGVGGGGGGGGGGLLGPLKGGTPSGPSALIFSSREEKEAWHAELLCACEPVGMQSVAPDPPSTLVHHEPGAGFMSKLASPCERRVKINSSERTLTVFEDAKSVSLAKVLLLDPEPSAPGREAQAVKIGFSALAEGPPRDWSNLRIEVWAPVLGDRAGQHKQHYFRARNYKEFLQWVTALAAL